MSPHHEDSFHPFPSLPKELRLQIWEDVIPQERMIRISLAPHRGRRYDLASAAPRYQRRNHLNKPISGERYRAVVHGRHLNSKYLRVNSEARSVALAFYRVQVPVYMTGPTHTERSVLYFNPEHDFLHIWADAPVKDTLIDFLWDLRAYDPRGVGLRKLGVDLEGFCANDLQYLRKCDLLLIRQRTVLVETLSQLSDVWFINLQASSTSGWKPQQRMSFHHTSRCHFRNNGPVLGDVPIFQRLGVDCRSGVEDELEKVYMGDVDPREVLFRWRRLLRTWGVEYEISGQVDYRLFVGNVPLDFPKQQQSVELAEVQLAMEVATLEKNTAGDQIVEDLEYLPKYAGSSATQRPGNTGFWLFPLEAVGELGEGERLADMDFLPRRVLDMRNHRPELVLSKLS